MVFFKDVTASTQAYLVILDEEDQSIEKGTRLVVHEPLMGRFAPEWPKLTNPLRRASWTSEVQMGKTPTSWILESAHHRPSKDVAPLQTLGRRIIEGNAKWEDTIGMVGEFHYLKGYWEWTEDILCRCTKELRGVGIYDAVYASLFTYDGNNDVLKAFCEAWCPSTNTLLTLSGELSISLWDLQDLSGLPTMGAFYEEVVPSKKELFGVIPGGKQYVPTSCRYLFHAYHLLQDGSSGSQSSHVSLEKWINFWSKNVLRYQQPPPRKEKRSVRPKRTHNPTGDLKGHKVWTSTDRSPFMKLDIKERYWTETYLAAYLACWLCSFVLPEGDANTIRPDTFKMASIMAARNKVSLTIPVLASIYKGLNNISNSSEPSQVKSTFPVHFVHGWLAHYFETHFRLDIKKSIPKMIKFSGEGGARPYSFTQARRRIHKWDKVSWNCTTLTKNMNISYVDGDFGDSMEESTHQSYFAAIRSSYLARRLGDSFVIEPYSPHRFSRQFGYYQVVPGVLSRTIREASLEDGLKYWRICLLRKSMSTACFPSPPPNARKFFSVDYRNWWDQVYKNFSEMALIPQLVDAPENHEEVDPPNGKRKEIDDALDGSASSNVGDNEDCHWKRKKHDKPLEPAKSHTGDSRCQVDMAVREALKEVLGSDYSEESQNDHVSIETQRLDEVSKDDVVSKFDGKALFDNHCKSFLNIFWSDLRAKVMKTPIDFISSLQEEVYAGFSLMKNTPHSFDLACLKKSIDLLFANAAAYDEARSTSLDHEGHSTQRSKEVKDCLRDAKVKESEEAAQIESIKKEIAELDEKKRNLLASLKGHNASLMSSQNKIKEFEEELAKINSAFDEEACKKLKSSRSLLELAQKALEDQNPFA